MNRKGFTLMELLLVVAVLAIVAAAAAPTFFGGAKEAMEEAKKSSFLSSYQNTLSGANLYISSQAAKGIIVNTGDLQGNLDNYAPVASRRFDLGNNISGTLSAQFNTTTNAVEVVISGKTTPIVLDPTANLDYTNLCTLVSSAQSGQ